MFLAPNTRIIENRVKKKNLEQIFPKFYNFLFWTLICIINYKWWRHPIIIKRCAHYQTTGTESFILIAWKLQILGPKNLWGVHLTPPLGRSRVNYILIWGCTHVFSTKIKNICCNFAKKYNFCKNPRWRAKWRTCCKNDCCHSNSSKLKVDCCCEK